MSTRSPAAILFDLTGSAYAVQGNPLHATGSVALSQPVIVQTLPNISGAVHVTNSLLNVTGTVGIGGPVAAQIQNQVAVTVTSSLPVTVMSGNVGVYTHGPQAVSGSVNVHTQGAQAVSGTVHVTTTGSFPVVIQGQPIQVTGSVGIGGPVTAQVTNFPTVQQVWDPGTKSVSGSVNVYTSGPQAVTGTVSTYTQGPQLVSGTVLVTGSVATYTQGPQLVSGTVQVSGSVSTYTQGPQLVSGTVIVSGSVAVYTQGPQNVTGSVAVYTQGPQNVTGSVSVFTQGAQLVSGTVNLGNWPPVIAVSGSQVTGSTFHGMPVVIGGVSGSTVRAPAIVDAEPLKNLFALVTRNLEVTRPTFFAVYDRIAPAANKYMATLFNTSSSKKVVIQRAHVLNWQEATVNGALLSQEFKRITARTAGTTVTPAPEDTADVLPVEVTADHNSSAVSDSTLIKRVWATGEEVFLSSNAFMLGGKAMDPFGIVYERAPGTRGLTLRQNQGVTFKNITSSTVGTVSYIIEFTVEDA